MEALSRGAAAHQPVVLEILSELMDTETYVDPHVTEYGKHLIGNHSIFSIMITKTLTNAVKSYLDKKNHTMEHHQSQSPHLNILSRSLENHP